MREVRFALGYMPHRLWGNLLQAQLLEKEPGKEFFTPREYVQNDPSTKAYQRLTPMQREVVGLIDAYNDRNLHRQFSRKKTVKEFQDTVEKDFIRARVRPFIEIYLHAALLIARDNRLPVFTKEKGNRNVFPEDFLRLQKIPAEPVFSFRYGEGLSYTLNLGFRGEKLHIGSQYMEVVCNDPSVIILGSSLYFVNDIDSKKLLPFREKDEVVIPQTMEKKYFSTFVRNTIRDFETRLEGIAIRDMDPEREAEICLESGVDGKPVFILSFRYNGKSVQANSKLQWFVSFSGFQPGPGFERFGRDKVWEESVINALKEMGFRSRDDISFFPDGGDLYGAVGFVNEVSAGLDEMGIRLRQRLDKTYFAGQVTLRLDSFEKDDWFDIRSVVSFGEYQVPFVLLKDHILSGNREYPLPDGQVAILPEEWFARYRSMFEFGRIEGERMLLQKQHFSMMDHAVKDIHADTMERLEKLYQAGSIPAISVPAGLQADLRTYQVEGYTWLCFLQQSGFGGCLADDMGLGKTLQALAVILRSGEQHENDSGHDGQAPHKPKGQLQLFGDAPARFTSLVVVPASLLHNWYSECSRFAPSLKVCLHVGNQRNRELTNFGSYDLVISTYHTVRQDIELFSDFLFHYVILDESQMIKNPSSKLYHAVTELRAEHRIVLTGTPIENSLTDLWSQVNFVNPGLLGTLGFFKKSFVQPIEKKKDEAREQKLKELISPFILRRTKQEVATELPPVFEQVRYCNMSEGQRRVYEEEKSLARNSILENLEESGLEQSSMVVLQALTRLRQIANHPAMLEDYAEIDSGKFQEVCRDVENVVAEGHKVLMFSSFVKHLELFRVSFDQTGLKYACLTGSSTQKQRKTAVQEFQNDRDCPVFLISLKAGGVGLNLTAADYVFLLDPWWNPAAELQALNRAHRIGQEKNVFVIRFLSGDTIEEKIQRLQQRKRELAETFVSANNPLRDLSEKEVLELFS